MRITHHAQLAANFSQAHIGVVFTQLQTELCTAGEHAVWLGHALGGQVIHEHAQIGLIAARGPSIKVTRLQASVDASEHALGSRLFVTRGAINLASKEQALNLACFKTGFQTTGVKVVVLNRVTRAQDVRVLQTLH